MKMVLAVLLLLGCSVNAKNIELTTLNSVVLRNEVNDETITKLQVELAQKVAIRGTRGYTIYLVLDSPGGSIESGLNFIEFAKTVPNLETVTLFAASMASAIVEALPGRRYITETGTLMFHRARGGIDGQFDNGELESRLDYWQRKVRILAQKNADRMGISLESYRAKIANELWIFGKDTITQKAADEIVSVTCSHQLTNSSAIETFSIMGMFTIDVSFSGCPLIRGGRVVDQKQQAQYKAYRAEKWDFRGAK